MSIDAHYAYNWQATAHRILGELITEGRDNGLPPLLWMLATTGALVGEAPGLATDPDQRTSITAWATHLGASVTETARDDGRVILHAPFSRRGERVGALRAELFPKRDDDLKDDAGRNG